MVCGIVPAKMNGRNMSNCTPASMNTCTEAAFHPLSLMNGRMNTITNGVKMMACSLKLMATSSMTPAQRHMPRSAKSNAPSTKKVWIVSTCPQMTVLYQNAGLQKNTMTPHSGLPVRFRMCTTTTSVSISNGSTMAFSQLTVV